MKIKHIAHINSELKIPEFAIATTDKCQAQCAHCLMKSSPKRGEKLSVEQMWQLISYLKLNHDLNVVVFTGGESTLLGDDLYEIIARCSVEGLATRLVTNAIWADTPANAARKVASFRECGLDEINYSTDDFHCVWIPLDNIKNAWEASKNVGFKSVVIGLCSGPRSKVTPETLCEFLAEKIPYIYDKEGKKSLPDPANDGTLYAISNTQISRLGRGQRLRADYINWGSLPVLGGCPGLFKPFTMMGDGSLGFCCGINSEGNRILSLSEVEPGVYGAPNGISDDTQAILLKAIRVLGPAYLYTLATGIEEDKIESKFSSMCEVCERLTSNNDLVAILLSQIDHIAAKVYAMEYLTKGVMRGQGIN